MHLPLIRCAMSRGALAARRARLIALLLLLLLAVVGGDAASTDIRVSTVAGTGNPALGPIVDHATLPRSATLTAPQALLAFPRRSAADPHCFLIGGRLAIRKLCVSSQSLSMGDPLASVAGSVTTVAGNGGATATDHSDPLLASIGRIGDMTWLSVPDRSSLALSSYTVLFTEPDFCVVRAFSPLFGVATVAGTAGRCTPSTDSSGAWQTSTDARGLSRSVLQNPVGIIQLPRSLATQTSTSRCVASFIITEQSGRRLRKLVLQNACEPTYDATATRLDGSAFPNGFFRGSLSTVLKPPPTGLFAETLSATASASSFGTSQPRYMAFGSGDMGLHFGSDELLFVDECIVRIVLRSSEVSLTSSVNTLHSYSAAFSDLSFFGFVYDRALKCGNPAAAKAGPVFALADARTLIWADTGRNRILVGERNATATQLGIPVWNELVGGAGNYSAGWVDGRYNQHSGPKPSPIRMKDPVGFSFDEASQRLFFVDQGYNVVRMVDAVDDSNVPSRRPLLGSSFGPTKAHYLLYHRDFHCAYGIVRVADASLNGMVTRTLDLAEQFATAAGASAVVDAVSGEFHIIVPADGGRVVIDHCHFPVRIVIRLQDPQPANVNDLTVTVTSSSLLGGIEVRGSRFYDDASIPTTTVNRLKLSFTDTTISTACSDNHGCSTTSPGMAWALVAICPEAKLVGAVVTFSNASLAFLVPKGLPAFASGDQRFYMTAFRTAADSSFLFYNTRASFVFFNDGNGPEGVYVDAFDSMLPPGIPDTGRPCLSRCRVAYDRFDWSVTGANVEASIFGTSLSRGVDWQLTSVRLVLPHGILWPIRTGLFSSPEVNPAAALLNTFAIRDLWILAFSPMPIEVFKAVPREGDQLLPQTSVSITGTLVMYAPFATLLEAFVNVATLTVSAAVVDVLATRVDFAWASEFGEPQFPSPLGATVEVSVTISASFVSFQGACVLNAIGVDDLNFALATHTVTIDQRSRVVVWALQPAKAQLSRRCLQPFDLDGFGAPSPAAAAPYYDRNRDWLTADSHLFRTVINAHNAAAATLISFSALPALTVAEHFADVGTAPHSLPLLLDTACVDLPLMGRDDTQPFCVVNLVGGASTLTVAQASLVVVDWSSAPNAYDMALTNSDAVYIAVMGEPRYRSANRTSRYTIDGASKVGLWLHPDRQPLVFDASIVEQYVTGSSAQRVAGGSSVFCFLSADASPLTPGAPSDQLGQCGRAVTWTVVAPSDYPSWGETVPNLGVIELLSVNITANASCAAVRFPGFAGIRAAAVDPPLSRVLINRVTFVGCEGALSKEDDSTAAGIGFTFAPAVSTPPPATVSFVADDVIVIVRCNTWWPPPGLAARVTDASAIPLWQERFFSPLFSRTCDNCSNLDSVGLKGVAACLSGSVAYRCLGPTIVPDAVNVALTDTGAEVFIRQCTFLKTVRIRGMRTDAFITIQQSVFLDGFDIYAGTGQPSVPALAMQALSNMNFLATDSNFSKPCRGEATANGSFATAACAPLVFYASLPAAAAVSIKAPFWETVDDATKSLSSQAPPPFPLLDDIQRAYWETRGNAVALLRCQLKAIRFVDVDVSQFPTPCTSCGFPTAYSLIAGVYIAGLTQGLFFALTDDSSVSLSLSGTQNRTAGPYALFEPVSIGGRTITAAAVGTTTDYYRMQVLNSYVDVSHVTIQASSSGYRNLSPTTTASLAPIFSVLGMDHRQVDNSLFSLRNASVILDSHVPPLLTCVLCRQRLLCQGALGADVAKNVLGMLVDVSVVLRVAQTPAITRATSLLIAAVHKPYFHPGTPYFFGIMLNVEPVRPHMNIRLHLARVSVVVDTYPEDATGELQPTSLPLRSSIFSAPPTNAAVRSMAMVTLVGHVQFATWATVAVHSSFRLWVPGVSTVALLYDVGKASPSGEQRRSLLWMSAYLDCVNEGSPSRVPPFACAPRASSTVRFNLPGMPSHGAVFDMCSTGPLTPTLTIDNTAYFAPTLGVLASFLGVPSTSQFPIFALLACSLVQNADVFISLSMPSNAVAVPAPDDGLPANATLVLSFVYTPRSADGAPGGVSALIMPAASTSGLTSAIRGGPWARAAAARDASAGGEATTTVTLRTAGGAGKPPVASPAALFAPANGLNGAGAVLVTSDGMSVHVLVWRDISFSTVTVSGSLTWEGVSHYDALTFGIFDQISNVGVLIVDVQLQLASVSSRAAAALALVVNGAVHQPTATTPWPENPGVPAGSVMPHHMQVGLFVTVLRAVVAVHAGRKTASSTATGAVRPMARALFIRSQALQATTSANLLTRTTASPTAADHLDRLSVTVAESAILAVAVDGVGGVVDLGDTIAATAGVDPNAPSVAFPRIPNIVDLDLRGNLITAATSPAVDPWPTVDLSVVPAPVSISSLSRRPSLFQKFKAMFDLHGVDEGAVVPPVTSTISEAGVAGHPSCVSLGTFVLVNRTVLRGTAILAVPSRVLLMRNQFVGCADGGRLGLGSRWSTTSTSAPPRFVHGTVGGANPFPAQLATTQALSHSPVILVAQCNTFNGAREANSKDWQATQLLSPTIGIVHEKCRRCPELFRGGLVQALAFAPDALDDICAMPNATATVVVSRTAVTSASVSAVATRTRCCPTHTRSLSIAVSSTASLFPTATTRPTKSYTIRPSRSSTATPNSISTSATQRPTPSQSQVPTRSTSATAVSSSVSSTVAPLPTRSRTVSVSHRSQSRPSPSRASFSASLTRPSVSRQSASETSSHSLPASRTATISDTERISSSETKELLVVPKPPRGVDTILAKGPLGGVSDGARSGVFVASASGSAASSAFMSTSANNVAGAGRIADALFCSSTAFDDTEDTELVIEEATLAPKVPTVPTTANAPMRAADVGTPEEPLLAAPPDIDTTASGNDLLLDAVNASDNATVRYLKARLQRKLRPPIYIGSDEIDLPQRVSFVATPAVRFGLDVDDDVAVQLGALLVTTATLWCTFGIMVLTHRYCRIRSILPITSTIFSIAVTFYGPNLAELGTGLAVASIRNPMKHRPAVATGIVAIVMAASPIAVLAQATRIIFMGVLLPPPPELKPKLTAEERKLRFRWTTAEWQRHHKEEKEQQRALVEAYVASAEANDGHNKFFVALRPLYEVAKRLDLRRVRLVSMEDVWVAVLTSVISSLRPSNRGAVPACITFGFAQVSVCLGHLFYLAYYRPFISWFDLACSLLIALLLALLSLCTVAVDVVPRVWAEYVVIAGAYLGTGVFFISNALALWGVISFVYRTTRNLSVACRVEYQGAREELLSLRHEGDGKLLPIPDKDGANTAGNATTEGSDDVTAAYADTAESLIARIQRAALGEDQADVKKHTVFRMLDAVLGYNDNVQKLNVLLESPVAALASPGAAAVVDGRSDAARALGIAVGGTEGGRRLLADAGALNVAEDGSSFHQARRTTTDVPPLADDDGPILVIPAAASSTSEFVAVPGASTTATGGDPPSSPFSRFLKWLGVVPSVRNAALSPRQHGRNTVEATLDVPMLRQVSAVPVPQGYRAGAVLTHVATSAPPVAAAVAMQADWNPLLADPQRRNEGGTTAAAKPATEPQTGLWDFGVQGDGRRSLFVPRARLPPPPPSVLAADWDTTTRTTSGPTNPLARSTFVPKPSPPAPTMLSAPPSQRPGSATSVATHGAGSGILFNQNSPAVPRNVAGVLVLELAHTPSVAGASSRPSSESASGARAPVGTDWDVLLANRDPASRPGTPPGRTGARGASATIPSWGQLSEQQLSTPYHTLLSRRMPQAIRPSSPAAPAGAAHPPSAAQPPAAASNSFASLWQWPGLAAEKMSKPNK